MGLRGLLLIYIYREKTLLKKPHDLSPCLLGLPALRLRVASGALLPYFLTSLGTTAAVISL